MTDPATDTLERARGRALSLLTRRDRSRRELQRALARRGFESSVIDTVLHSLEEAKLLDEARLAENWAGRRLRQRYGSRRVMQELNARGIDRETAARAVEGAYGDIDEAELARSFLVGRGMTAASFQPPDLARTVRILQRRGFSHAVVGRVRESYFP